MSIELVGAISHHEREMEELRADSELATEYLRAAIDCLDDPESRTEGLLALRAVAEAYGGLSAVAAQAGMSCESLDSALSPKGNSSINAVIAVLRVLGLRLSIEPRHHAPA